MLNNKSNSSTGANVAHAAAAPAGLATLSAAPSSLQPLSGDRFLAAYRLQRHVHPMQNRGDFLRRLEDDATLTMLRQTGGTPLALRLRTERSIVASVGGGWDVRGDAQSSRLLQAELLDGADVSLRMADVMTEWTPVNQPYYPSVHMMLERQQLRGPSFD